MVEKRLSHSGCSFKVAEGDLLLSLAQLDQIARQGHQHLCSCSRYEHKSTVITTNRAFKEWGEVFPNAACTVSLIDRLVHRCEVVAIEGESYRLKEAKARAELKAAQRCTAKTKAGKS